MFIVRKMSGSGSAYLVNGVKTKYRWGKVAKSKAMKFKHKSTALYSAKKFKGLVVKD